VSAVLIRTSWPNAPHISLDAFERYELRLSARITKIAVQARMARPSASDLLQNAFVLDPRPELRTDSRSGAWKTRV
jgi:hypothetical protein